MAKRKSWKLDGFAVIVLVSILALIVLDMVNNKNTTQPALASGVSITK